MGSFFKRRELEVWLGCWFVALLAMVIVLDGMVLPFGLPAMLVTLVIGMIAFPFRFLVLTVSAYFFLGRWLPAYLPWLYGFNTIMPWPVTVLVGLWAGWIVWRIVRRKSPTSQRGSTRYTR